MQPNKQASVAPVWRWHEMTHPHVSATSGSTSSMAFSTAVTGINGGGHLKVGGTDKQSV